VAVFALATWNAWEMSASGVRRTAAAI